MIENDIDNELEIENEPLTEVEQELYFTQRDITNSAKTYAMVKQDSATNALSRASQKGIKPQEFTNNGIITTKNGNTDLKLIIEDYSKVALKQSTSKLLRLLTIKFTEEGGNNKLIKISLREAMADLGLKDEKDARAKIKKDLQTLYNISCEVQKPNRKGEKDFLTFRIIDAKSIENSVIYANFSDAIFQHLQKCDPMPYPKQLLKIESNSQKNPYALYLGDKIVELKKLNQYEKIMSKDGKRVENIILKRSFNVSVKVLIDICVESGMPSYETIKDKSRHVDKLIIAPFERDLTACSTNIFDWEYCNAKGVRLTDKQLEKVTYKEFIDRYVKITFKEDYPVAMPNIKKVKKADK